MSTKTANTTHKMEPKRFTDRGASAAGETITLRLSFTSLRLCYCYGDTKQRHNQQKQPPDNSSYE